MRVCLSEQGTVWLPYTLRKMDHAFLMGRKAKWAENGRLDRAPVARSSASTSSWRPFPEENVQRVVAEVGIEPIVFGSDFPHGEGLAYPGEYAAAQLGELLRTTTCKRIMRDNLADFLGDRLIRRSARPASSTCSASAVVMCVVTTSTAGLRRRSECRTATSTVVIGPRTSADHPRSACRARLSGRVLRCSSDPSLRTTSVGPSKPDDGVYVRDMWLLSRKNTSCW